MKLLRFEELREQCIVRTWTTLNDWVDNRGFPPGRVIGRFRTWTEAEVLDWIDRQPSAKAPARGAVKKSNGGSQCLGTEHRDSPTWQSHTWRPLALAPGHRQAYRQYRNLLRIGAQGAKQ
jgi:predicted DNA-binding transcriptional regulator AlpA